MAGANIDLCCIGVSHRTAPVAVRERLAVEPEAVAAALVELTALPAVREAALISHLQPRRDLRGRGRRRSRAARRSGR